jgi:hypothetical protein
VPVTAEAGWVTPPPLFSDKLLVFHRGCGTCSETGLYYNDKTEELFNRMVCWAKHVALR